MTAFKSKWADWEPETPSQRTDKTDKRASVSSVSTSPTHIQGTNVDSGRDETTPDALTYGTDKTDKRGDGHRDAFEERAAILQFDGGFSREEAERRAAVDQAQDLVMTRVFMNTLSNWDVETARLVDWFLTTEPPEGPFALYPHHYIARPGPYWEYVKDNLRLGPGGPRARWRALQKDLRRLAELFGGPR